MIHPTAIIATGAQIDSSATVGPYAVIDEHVVLGSGCIVGPHVYITGHTTIGANNRFHAGCVIGDAPQDLSYKDAPTRVQIGANNDFREQVTVHRSSNVEHDTIIGSNCLLMANAHVAHNCILGNHVILANGVLLGGHATVGDRAFLSGHCLVHQFTRVGMLALMRGGSRISKDLPPFAIANNANTMCGLNIIGLRRAGYTPQQRLELKKLYHDLFRSHTRFVESLAAARVHYTSDVTRLVIDFSAAAKRGICCDASFSNGGENDTALE
jgi:UDP-N-acetylglucosamine acyltransferase